MSLTGDNMFSVTLLNGERRLGRAERVRLQRGPKVTLLVGRRDCVRPIGQDVPGSGRRVGGHDTHVVQVNVASVCELKHFWEKASKQIITWKTNENYLRVNTASESHLM